MRLHWLNIVLPPQSSKPQDIGPLRHFGSTYTKTPPWFKVYSMQEPTGFLLMFSTSAHSTTRDVFTFFWFFLFCYQLNLLSLILFVCFVCFSNHLCFLMFGSLSFYFFISKKKKKTFLVSCTCPQINMLEVWLAVLSR